MQDYIKKDVVKTVSHLNYIHIAYTYLFDCNLLSMLLRVAFITTFVHSSAAKSLKLSFIIMFFLSLYRILMHTLNPVTPGIIVDFIGEVPSLPILLVLDFQIILLELLALFSKLQEETELSEEESEIQEFCFVETIIDVPEIFRTYWSVGYFPDLSFLDANTDEESESPPASLV